MSCKTIDLQNTLILRLRPDLKVYYANEDFSGFTGFSQEEVLLTSVEEVLPFSIPEVFLQYLKENLPEDEEKPAFLILKGKTKTGDCYWGIMRISLFKSKLSGENRYLIQIKMLPNDAVLKSEAIFDRVEKVYESAGPEFAIKYFGGYLEEKNMDFKEFIFETVGVSPKKLNKYFKI